MYPLPLSWCVYRSPDWYVTSMQAPRRARKMYKPGDTAPVSGVYMVVHQGHRENHEVVILRGEQLPTCRGCHDAVRFQVKRQASHITHDWDFAGPGSVVLSVRR